MNPGHPCIRFLLVGAILLSSCGVPDSRSTNEPPESDELSESELAQIAELCTTLRIGAVRIPHYQWTLSYIGATDDEIATLVESLPAVIELICENPTTPFDEIPEFSDLSSLLEGISSRYAEAIGTSETRSKSYIIAALSLQTDAYNRECEVASLDEVMAMDETEFDAFLQEQEQGLCSTRSDGREDDSAWAPTAFAPSAPVGTGQAGAACMEQLEEVAGYGYDDSCSIGVGYSNDEATAAGFVIAVAIVVGGLVATAIAAPVVSAGAALVIGGATLAGFTGAVASAAIAAGADDSNANEGNANEGNANDSNSNEGNSNDSNSNDSNSNDSNSNENNSNENNSNDSNSNEGNSNEGNSNEGNSNEGNSNGGTASQGGLGCSDPVNTSVAFRPDNNIIIPYLIDSSNVAFSNERGFPDGMAIFNYCLLVATAGELAGLASLNDEDQMKMDCLANPFGPDDAPRPECMRLLRDDNETIAQDYCIAPITCPDTYFTGVGPNGTCSCYSSTWVEGSIANTVGAATQTCFQTNCGSNSQCVCDADEGVGICGCSPYGEGIDGAEVFPPLP